MANYINDSILSQSYVHVDAKTISIDEFNKFKELIDSFIKDRGKFFIYTDVESDVEVHEGSLKMYATILGSLWIAIGQYPSFREGIILLYEDSQRLANAISTEALFQSKSRHQNIIKIESRPGVVGSLNRIIKLINQADNIDRDFSGKISVNRLSILKNKIDKLLKNLSKSPKDLQYIKINLLIEINKMPPLKMDLGRNVTSEHINDYKSELKEIKDLLAITI